MRRLLVLGAAAILISSATSHAAETQTLIEAVKAADRVAIRTLLQRGADVDDVESDGTTALHWAAHNGDLETVSTLIRAKAAVNRKNRYGVSPIWVAATNGHASVVKALLQSGADPHTTRGDSGETVLMVAARGGHVGVLQQLLAFGADPNVQERVRRQTALMWAAAERHTEAARLLVEAGANLETRSSTGLTALMFAIRAGSIDTTMMLLQHGADLTATAPDGTTALGLAIINAHWELAKELLDSGASASTEDPRGRPLHLVAWMRRADNRGLSAWLPRKGRADAESITFAKALLAHGAAINDRLAYANGNYNPTHMALGGPGTTYMGATPLYIAAKNCDLEFIKFLVASGADPKIPNAMNVTPLLAAAGIGYTIGESPGTPEEAFEAVKLFKDLGNDLTAIVSMGVADTSSTRERQGGGAGLNIRPGWDGAGALHGAVIRGAHDLVTWLIAQGLPLDLKTKAGQTPLDLARGSSLGITFHVQPELAEIIEKAMRAKGLPVPEHQYGNDTR